MTLCAWCRKRFWPWQRTILDVAGREHEGCWRARWDGFFADGNSLAYLDRIDRFEALLAVPPEHFDTAYQQVYGTEGGAP